MSSKIILSIYTPLLESLNAKIFFYILRNTVLKYLKRTRCVYLRGILRIQEIGLIIGMTQKSTFEEFSLYNT